MAIKDLTTEPHGFVSMAERDAPYCRYCGKREGDPIHVKAERRMVCVDAENHAKFVKNDNYAVLTAGIGADPNYVAVPRALIDDFVDRVDKHSRERTCQIYSSATNLREYVRAQKVLAQTQLSRAEASIAQIFARLGASGTTHGPGSIQAIRGCECINCKPDAHKFQHTHPHGQ